MCTSRRLHIALYEKAIFILITSSYMVGERGVYKVLVGKPEGKRPLGRPRRRCEDRIGMDIREMGVGCGMVSVGSG
jgi:hypothetical protein